MVSFTKIIQHLPESNSHSTNQRSLLDSTVRHSAEVGWLVGTLERNGQRGLLPENYVKFI